jgi:hypothetical protein
MMADARSRLVEVRSDLLRELGAAAQAQDSARAFALADKLRAVETLIRSYQELDGRAEGILSNESIGRAQAVEQLAMMQQPSSDKTPARAHGAQLRSQFIAWAHGRGVPLKRTRGSVFEASDGTKIGIAVATERQPGRWFLGLKDGAFDAAVLLCQRDGGTLMTICLPQELLKRHGDRLSRSGGQVKFNVANGPNGLALVVPQTGHVALDRYLDAVGELTSVGQVAAAKAAAYADGLWESA